MVGGSLRPPAASSRSRTDPAERQSVVSALGTLADLDGKAKRLGLSRAAHLRRTLERERVEWRAPVSLDGLERCGGFPVFTDDVSVDGGDCDARLGPAEVDAQH